MKIKIKGKVKRNTLKKSLIGKEIRDLMLDIAKDSLSPMKDRLNKTEAPESDPRKSFVDVKKWRVGIISHHSINDGFGYSVLFRAINTQAPTYYIAYRTLKLPQYEYDKSMGYFARSASYNKREVRKRFQADKPITRYYDSSNYDNPKVLTHKEMREATKLIREMRDAALMTGSTPREASGLSKMMMSKYKKLIAVKVTIDNIAFSRLFNARNTIRPNKSKYGPYSYARCLKIWNSTTFNYAMYSNPKSNDGKYYYSRVGEMSNTLVDVVER